MKSFKLSKSKEENKAFGQKPRKKRKKISESYLYNSGLYYLERFPASVAHFKVVMNRKIERSFEDHPDQNREDITQWLDKVAQRFVELGYLNDVLFARGLINSLRRKGTSSTKIIMTLKQKGVDSETAKEVLQEVDADNVPSSDSYGEALHPDLNAALVLCRKKKMSADDYNSDSMDYEDQMKLKNKYLGRLARQGFSFDIALKALELAAAEDDY